MLGSIDRLIEIDKFVTNKAWRRTHVLHLRNLAKSFKGEAQVSAVRLAAPEIEWRPFKTFKQ